MLEPPSSSARAAQHQIERVNDLLGHMRISRLLLGAMGDDCSVLQAEIQRIESYKYQLHAAANQRIETRGRSRKVPLMDYSQRPTYYLFLDECGSHVTGNIDAKFPLFCLSGIIVSSEEYEAFDVTWKAWKTKHLGGPDIISHEPDLRANSRGFRREDPNERATLLNSLDEVLSSLNFSCIAAVVDLGEFQRLHPDSHVDDYLPRSCYLMAINFVMERFVHFLQQSGDAKGHVFAESRGLKEDALVHAEFIGLHLKGTQFVSESDFRYQLRPFIEFYRKSRNNSGLQIADLAARPLADIVKNPGSSPSRWDVFRNKLYDGNKGCPHKYGLKVFPLSHSNDPFPELER